MGDLYGPRTCFRRRAELAVQVLGLYLEKGCWRTMAGTETSDFKFSINVDLN